MYKKYSHHSEKKQWNKNIFDKNGRRCRDVKTQKVCEQVREVNVGTKIKQTTFI